MKAKSSTQVIKTMRGKVESGDTVSTKTSRILINVIGTAALSHKCFSVCAKQLFYSIKTCI